MRFLLSKARGSLLFIMFITQGKLYDLICEKHPQLGPSDKTARKSVRDGGRKNRSSSTDTSSMRGSVTDGEEKVSVKTEIVEQVISAQVDFVFCSSWT